MQLTAPENQSQLELCFFVFNLSFLSQVENELSHTELN